MPSSSPPHTPHPTPTPSCRTITIIKLVWPNFSSSLLYWAVSSSETRLYNITILVRNSNFCRGPLTLLAFSCNEEMSTKISHLSPIQSKPSSTRPSILRLYLAWPPGDHDTDYRAPPHLTLTPVTVTCLPSPACPAVLQYSTSADLPRWRKLSRVHPEPGTFIIKQIHLKPTDRHNPR